MKAAYPLQAARTLALHAQGLTLDNGSEPPPTQKVLYRLIDQLVSLQIDTLQRVRRTHYLVPWSRMGNYDPVLLDELAYGNPEKEKPEDGRKLFEYWFHAACYLPLEEYRFRIPRMHSSRAGRRERTRTWLAKPETQKLLKQVYARVKREGALRVRDFEDERDERGLWWDWKPAKNALEHLYNCGDLMIAERIRFERVYDLVERVLPDWVEVEVPTYEEAALHVLERSAKALGISTAAQIADYSHDMGRNDARPFIEQLLHRGTLIQVRVESAAEDDFKMVIHKDNKEHLESAAEGSLKAQRTTFLSPFDSFFYPKGRDEQLWGFRQVLEAYKPASEREWGYYCLPILYKDRLIGRLDPRLDRRTGKLHLEALYLEPGIELEDVIISAIAFAMNDFMKFHRANELIIEQSRPRTLAKSLMSAL
jgi:uncharacterized protein YcaQ